MKLLLSSLLLFSLMFAHETDDDDGDIAKMVYHCDFNDDDRYNLMMANIRYAVDYYNANLIEYDIRVVANSECVRYLFKKDFKNLKAPSLEIKQKIKARASGHDIEFSICGNTLDALGIDKKILEPHATLVTSGVVEVVKLQQEDNFGYLKVR